MSSGDVDAEPYLDSRNTIGHGNHNSNSQSKTGQNGEVVDVEDDLVAMMSGGVLDVDTKMM